MWNIPLSDWWKRNSTIVCYSIFIMAAGTLLHFAYEWSDENAIIAIFSAVNESVWEHLKIFFVPAFFYTLFAFCLKEKDCPEYLWCQTKSILAGLSFIIITYFTYTGIVKQNCSVVDISSFYVASVISGVISKKCMEKCQGRRSRFYKYAGLILLLLWALFICFSYQVPDALKEWMPGLFLE